MLRACNRVLKPGAPLVFFAVAIPDGLSEQDIGDFDAGPDFADTRPGYEELLTTAGFADIDVVDVTDGYATTLSASIRARDVESAELEELLGADEFVEGQENRRRELAAIDDGLLRRYEVSGVRHRL